MLNDHLSKWAYAVPIVFTKHVACRQGLLASQHKCSMLLLMFNDDRNNKVK